MADAVHADQYDAPRIESTVSINVPLAQAASVNPASAAFRPL